MTANPKSILVPKQNFTKKSLNNLNTGFVYLQSIWNLLDLWDLWNLWDLLDLLDLCGLWSLLDLWDLWDLWDHQDLWDLKIYKISGFLKNRVYGFMLLGKVDDLKT